MTIPIASDHAGFPAKEKIISILKKSGLEVLDLGTHSEESVDYPEYARKVAGLVDSKKYPLGVLVCGSGQGMCMVANKYKNVRAALVYSLASAKLTRQHNNANILCLPGRELSDEQLSDIIQMWFNTPFEGGRHQQRVDKISNVTN